jgi:hypothetical protein
VGDNGLAFAAGLAAFEPFFHQRQENGVGSLGRRLRIAQRHGGRSTSSRRSDKGLFSIWRLPRLPAAAETPPLCPQRATRMTHRSPTTRRNLAVNKAGDARDSNRH